MKKILSLTIKTVFLIALSGNALAANTDNDLAPSNVVFTGLTVGEDNSYAYLGGATAVNGDIDKDDVLIRASAGYGQYNYRAPALVDEKENGQITSTDLMLGYQKHFSGGRATVFGGANYDDHRLHKGDSGNRVAGGKAGAKAQFELLLEPSDKFHFNHIASYSSAYNSYWISNFLGWNCDDFSFGPEVTFLGNRAFNQQKIGVGFGKINIQSVSLFLSAGYMKSSGKAGDEGAYTSIGISTRF